MFFEWSTPVVWAVVIAVVVGTTLLGLLAGRRLGELRERLREPTGALQAALLGFVGLLLAFGLTMGVGRYEARRDAVVDEANAVETTWLRAQTLPEPTRTASLALIREYVDVRLALSGDIAGRLDFDLAVERSEQIHRELWTLAGQALDQGPTSNATLLYVDSLNKMIAEHTTRVTSFTTHIPTPVFWVQVAGSAVALGVLALYFATLGRGTLTVLLAAGMVVLILLVNIDLDRPRRGLIKVPTNALVSVRDEVNQPPAAAAPTSAPR